MISGAAIVFADGELEELDGGAGVELVRASPELQQYAVAVAELAEPWLSGLWTIDRQLYMIDLEANADGDRACARMHATAVEPPYGLTPRELDVVTLMTGGLSNDDIGALLGSGGRTVGKHVERILEKVGQSTRAGVAAIAAEEGVMRLPLPGSGRSLAALAAGRVHAHVAGRRALGSPPQRKRNRRPYVIGSAYPVTGTLAGDGEEMVLGSALAVTELNARGGIAGRPVEQIVVDVDPLNPTSVVTALESLVASEVDAVTSGWLVPEREAMDTVAPYGAPFLNTFTSEYAATLVREQRTDYPSVFQMCATEAAYGPGIIRSLDWLVASGAWVPHNRHLLFVEAQVQSGHIATEPTVDLAAASGWDVSLLGIPAQVDSWDEVLDQVRNVDPALVLLAHWIPSEVADFQRQFAANPTSALIYLLYAPSVPAFLHGAGAAAEGVLWSTLTGSYGDAIGRRFAQRFRSAFGREPGRSPAGVAYDNVNLLAEAWGRVGNPRRFASVTRELTRMPHRGVNGAYFLGTESQCALSYPDTTLDPSLGKAHLVLQIQNGRSRVLTPELYAEVEFRTPSWMTAAASV